MSEIPSGEWVPEGSLSFQFPAPWRMWKWDGDSAFKDGIRRLRDSHGVDFVGVRGTDLSCFIEVKDYRWHKRKWSNDELATWLAQKVRDTIAGIVGARYRRGNEEDWKLHLGAWFARRSLAVILWLEEKHLKKEEMAFLTDALKRKLRWLTTRVLVANLADPPPGFDFKAKSLPGAGQRQ